MDKEIVKCAYCESENLEVLSDTYKLDSMGNPIRVDVKCLECDYKMTIVLKVNQQIGA